MRHGVHVLEDHLETACRPRRRDEACRSASARARFSRRRRSPRGAQFLAHARGVFGRQQRGQLLAGLGQLHEVLFGAVRRPGRSWRRRAGFRQSGRPGPCSNCRAAAASARERPWCDPPLSAGTNRAGRSWPAAFSGPVSGRARRAAVRPSSLSCGSFRAATSIGWNFARSAGSGSTARASMIEIRAASVFAAAQVVAGLPSARSTRHRAGAPDGGELCVFRQSGQRSAGFDQILRGQTREDFAQLVSGAGSFVSLRIEPLEGGGEFGRRRQSCARRRALSELCRERLPPCSSARPGRAAPARRQGPLSSSASVMCADDISQHLRVARHQRLLHRLWSCFSVSLKQ